MGGLGPLSGPMWPVLGRCRRSWAVQVRAIHGNQFERMCNQQTAGWFIRGFVGFSGSNFEVFSSKSA